MYTAGIGFCNYEELYPRPPDDDRGRYNWTEQEVSDVPQLATCQYGPQFEGGMAERVCQANLIWTQYNGLGCITLSTLRLRQLTSVSYQFPFQACD